MTAACRFRAGLLTLAMLVGIVAARPGFAGEFGISPVQIDLDAGIRTAALTLQNSDKLPLSFQVRGMRWTQDTEGKEVYEDAGELIYFPRVLTVQPGQQAVVRVGLRQPASLREQTYRLFVEELPTRVPPVAGHGAQIRIALRFGAPVFARPAHPVYRLELPRFELSGSEAKGRVVNAGNVHQRTLRVALRGFDAQGAEVFSQEFKDRYLLAQQARDFSAQIAPGQCAQLARLEVEVKTDRSEVRQALAPGASACR